MAPIKHALAMFDQSHPHSNYVTVLQAQLDIGAKGWSSFGAFRAQLVEHFSVAVERDKFH